MGLKEYALKKIVGKVAGSAAMNVAYKSVQHAENKAEANALRNKANLASSTYTTVTTTKTTTVDTDENVYVGNADTYSPVSSKKVTKEDVSEYSYNSGPSVHLLTIDEKAIALRKTYVIKDCYGNLKYTAKRQGFPSTPEIGVYVNDKEIANLKESKDSGIAYVIKYKNKRIATLKQKLSLKPKYDIPESGWYIEGGLSETIIYDKNKAIAGKVQYSLLSSGGHAIVEYINPNDEILIMLIALAMITSFHS